jgi:hypothetical protein
MMRNIKSKSCQNGGIGSFLLGFLLCLFTLYYISSKGDSTQPTTISDSTDPIEILTKAQPSDLRPDGELEKIFSYGSDYTDLQRELKLKEITSKVVMWSLPVYEVRRRGNYYLIQTSSRSGKNIFDRVAAPQMVTAFLYITPKDDNDRRYIEGLMTGDMVTVKGIIYNLTLRTLDIRPAMLIRNSIPTTGATIPAPAESMPSNPIPDQNTNIVEDAEGDKSSKFFIDSDKH